MKRRILAAIVGVAVVCLGLLSLPLGWYIISNERDGVDRNFSLIAERAVNALTLDGDFGANGNYPLPDYREPVDVAVYDVEGRLVAGVGPKWADRITDSAHLLTLTGTTRTERVLARPVVAHQEKIGTVRVAEPLSAAGRRVAKVLVLLGGMNLMILGGAVVVGRWLSGRLVQPLSDIRDDAVRLGQGDFALAPLRSGIAELDATSEALADTAARLDAVLQRERSFTADVSHQLRTPLTSLRLTLENELDHPSEPPDEAIAGALADADRLESTITTLLRVARDQPTSRDALDLDSWAGSIRDRWNETFDAAGRSIALTAEDGRAHVSGAVLDQIVDILIQNALDHGSGRVSVTVETRDDHLDVVVGDDGSLTRATEDLFERRDPGAHGHGLGLALGRSLAEAEGGRLVVASSSPTSFRLVLPAGRFAQPRTAR